MPRLSSKNQITVPVDALREAGIKPGDELVVRAAGPGRLEVNLAEDVVSRFAGVLPPGTYPPAEERITRRPWRR